MNTKFTKKERLSIYKEMLKYLDSEKLDCYNGLCRIATVVVYNKLPKIAEKHKKMPFLVISYLSELRNKRPKDAIVFWWPISDRKSRQEALQQSIADILNSVKHNAKTH